MSSKTNEVIESISIEVGNTLLSALTQMDKVRYKLLIVKDTEGKFVNLISVGDIQRALIKGVALSTQISEIRIDKKIVSRIGTSREEIKGKMLELRCEFMPVIDDSKNLVSVSFWDELFESKPDKKIKGNFQVPVVIMAGGKGSRLKPLSNILPKPLVPIGEKTIIEEIIDRFADAGCGDFFLSVNYKRELIRYHLDSVIPDHLSISYFTENKPLGTAGSLSLLKGKLQTTFFVSNCDILIDQELSEVYQYHKSNSNDITLVAALKQYKIPYGTIISGKDGLLERMDEKPDLIFKINTGVYLLEPHLLNEIPVNEFFHITDLIESVKNGGGRVGVFPITEHSWIDVGEWPGYIKAVRKLSRDENFLGI